jgi:negative regulator of flagellin synthesis FlgM
MADKITGYGAGRVDIGATRSKAAVRAEAARESREAESAKARDDVRLTDTATNLKQIEARLAGVPDVDQKRVDEVRKRLESGSYQADAQRIAERLLKLDRQLA